MKVASIGRGANSLSVEAIARLAETEPIAKEPMVFPIVPLEDYDSAIKSLYAPAWDHPWPPRTKRRKK